MLSAGSRGCAAVWGGSRGGARSSSCRCRRLRRPIATKTFYTKNFVLSSTCLTFTANRQGLAGASGHIRRVSGGLSSDLTNAAAAAARGPARFIRLSGLQASGPSRVFANGTDGPGGETNLAKRQAVQHEKARPSSERRAARKLNWAARLENELDAELHDARIAGARDHAKVAVPDARVREVEVRVIRKVERFGA